MAFAFPEGLAPEVYPLAWLVGSWRGEGVISYPGIDDAPFVQDVTFDHDGGPYLRYESTIRLLEPSVPETVPAEWADAAEKASDAPEAAASSGSANGGVTPELTIWSTETGYWRIPPERPDDLPEGKTPLEVLLADPAGRVTLYVGAIGDARVDLVSDLMARTASSVEVTASSRLYGLVEGDLMWVWELAAFGHPLQSYASARLTRLDG
ncbi:protein of unknown function [Sanguibacter gelidistatuariae]|uniref:Ferric nitrobindin-like protein n=1 Tax=Sanguibacter gelidistatuariae TaxID=1814289 RepID=A0A1G6UC32_9MICO|nr:FABP family protein [Sanguibacter gelidistatuariae]SDD38950.1 protein of unknown function [Sanguibacter gelidistatuariae]